MSPQYASRDQFTVEEKESFRDGVIIGVIASGVGFGLMHLAMDWWENKRRAA